MEPPQASSSEESSPLHEVLANEQLSSHTSSKPSSVPPEVISYVLKLAMEDAPHQLNLLLAASLVCHLWSNIAREILWREVWIRKLSTAEAIVCSAGFGEYKTKSLTIAGGTASTSVLAEMVKTIVDGLRGIESLDLRYFSMVSGLSIEFMYSPSLVDLNSLTFIDTEISFPQPQVASNFASPVLFKSLNHLAFKGFVSVGTVTSCLQLLAPSTPTDLQFDPWDDDFSPQQGQLFLNLFELQAPRLVCYEGKIPPDGLYDEFYRRIWVTKEDVVSLLETLPAKLDSLELPSWWILKDVEQFIVTTWDFLRLSKLRCLILNTERFDTEYPDLLQRLKARGMGVGFEVSED